MTVFVVSDQRVLDYDTGEYVSKYDYSPAEEFGEIEYLLSPTANPFQNIEALIAELHSKLQSSTTDDYLILSGNPALMAAAAAIMAGYNDGWINLLQWHGYERKYRPITFQYQNKINNIFLK